MRQVCRLLQVLGQFQTVHVGHHQVGNHHIGNVLFYGFQCFYAIRRHFYTVVAAQDIAQEGAHVFVIVHYQHHPALVLLTFYFCKFLLKSLLWCNRSAGARIIYYDIRFLSEMLGSALEQHCECRALAHLAIYLDIAVVQIN